MAPAAGLDRPLKETPTWAVALVTAVFVIISIVIEHGINSIGKWFQTRRKKAMLEALEKIKAELMLLGFISLLITVGTEPISRICIPKGFINHMLPCKLKEKVDKDDDVPSTPDKDRKLLWHHQEDVPWRRFLAPGDNIDRCSKHDQVPLISQSGVHQLHIFIFVLAVFHVLYSIITIVLAQAKMKKWKSWEEETSSLEYQFNNDPSRFRLTHQTSFVRRHSGLSTAPGFRWIVAFFRQFFASVTKVDYMTMRHGFVNAHFAPNSKFDFHSYIKRSMEDDFKVVVGISIPLWICCIVFQVSNVAGSYTLSIISFLPLTILLIVGAKLELIIMDMAREIQDKTTVVKGAPIVEPNNKYFWFNRPHLILYLIHFTLFQNAFQMAYFLWSWYEFGLKSCFHERLYEILSRVFLGLALQILCSYITFPLYALVTQMGSHMKKAIFEEQTTKALKNWHKAAKQRKKQRDKSGHGGDLSSVGGFMSTDTTPSRGTSPMHLLQKYHNSTDLESVLNSPKSYYSETDISDNELSNHGDHAARYSSNPKPANNNEIANADFSFSQG